MTNWNHRLLALCEHIAQWSKDPSTKVGAVIANYDNQILGLGYNGFPRGVKDLPERLNDKEMKYKFVVHGEANAILNATTSVRGHTMYSSKFPCSECTKLIIQVGILRVVTRRPSGSEKWIKDAEASQLMMKEAGIFVIIEPELMIEGVE